MTGEGRQADGRARYWASRAERGRSTTLLMSGATTISRRRERELASDERSWPRNEARREQHEYLRRNWTSMVLGAALMLMLMPLVLSTPASSRGLAGGVLGVIVLWIVGQRAIAGSDTNSKMRGGNAERMTAQVLRRLQKRRWHVANHVLLHWSGDLDHVAVGPGGLIAFETKWIGNRRALVERVASDVEKLKNRAHWLFAMFPNHVPRDTRTSVLVLWGPGGAAWGPPTDVDGVVVVSGRHLAGWLTEMKATRLSDGVVSWVWGELVQQLTMRDEYELKRRGRPPRSVGDLASGALVCALAFLAALVVTLQMLE